MSESKSGGGGGAGCGSFLGTIAFLAIVLWAFFGYDPQAAVQSAVTWVCVGSITTTVGAFGVVLALYTVQDVLDTRKRRREYEAAEAERERQRADLKP